jgi:hypothetical protein
MNRALCHNPGADSLWGGNVVSVRPEWLGILLIVIIVVVGLIAITTVLSLVAPPVRRYIRQDQPAWWVRDIFIAAVVAVLVLFGQMSLVHSANSVDPETPQSQQSQSERLENLRFVRDRSSAAYQPRPFRQFDLSGMNLQGLQLSGANLVQANLSGANLTGTDLSSTAATPETPSAPATPAAISYLQGANLCHADLTGTNFRLAYLANANLTGVNLIFTQLRGAVLNGSDLSGATLPSDVTGPDNPLAGIYYDDNTVWPNGFHPPPSAPGDPLRFFGSPLQKKLFSEVPRPKCES